MKFQASVLPEQVCMLGDGWSACQRQVLLLENLRTRCQVHCGCHQQPFHQSLQEETSFLGELQNSCKARRSLRAETAAARKLATKSCCMCHSQATPARRSTKGKPRFAWKGSRCSSNPDQLWPGLLLLNSAHQTPDCQR